MTTINQSEQLSFLYKLLLTKNRAFTQALKQNKTYSDLEILYTEIKNINAEINLLRRHLQGQWT